MDSESDFFLPLTAESLLSYEIATFSSFEEPYIPFNITIDQPNNYDSRWTASSLKNEFLILKLTSKALLTSISFGKYKKPFSFNMKDFKVYVEDSSGQFNKVFNGTLRNNTEIEEFSIDYKEHAPIPCYLIKIKAINSWGFNSPVSIWSLKLKGIKDEKVVGFYDRQQKEKTKEIGFEGYMDFLMENHCKGGVDFIKKLGVLKPRKENFIEQLYELLIIKEDYKEVLVLLQDLMTKGIFNDYIAKLPYNFEWKQIIPIKYSSNEEDFDLLMSQQEKFFEPDNFYKKFGTRFKSSSNFPLEIPEKNH